MTIRVLFFLLAGLMTTPAQAQEPLVLTARDGVRIYGDHHPAKGEAKSVILLFHQAGSSRAEYATVAPRLAARGFAAIAIDQRSGGSLFGKANETVRQANRSYDYIRAYPDLEAALAHARARHPGKPVIAWGSSYSASLVFLLAANHPGEVAAILAFSPGEYFPASSLVARAAAKVGVPIFVTAASNARETQEAKAILAASPAKLKVQFAPQKGLHGSSTLHPKLNPEGAEEVWRAVEEFLAKALASAGG
jgi:dienelactone hydrolase